MINISVIDSIKKKHVELGSDEGLVVRVNINGASMWFTFMADTGCLISAGDSTEDIFFEGSIVDLLKISPKGEAMLANLGVVSEEDILPKGTLLQ
jgi:hypothetical protein